jgi:hypothetical protein
LACARIQSENRIGLLPVWPGRRLQCCEDANVFDAFWLLAAAPAGQDGDQELPGLENEVHGGPEADVGTSIGSGLE